MSVEKQDFFIYDLMAEKYTVHSVQNKYSATL